MTDLTREQIEVLLDSATPGRRVQFHGSYCKEAEGTPFTEWDSSHEMSVIRPDGSRYRLAHYKHAMDAYLSQMAPDLARQLLATMDALAEAQAAQAGVVEKIRDHTNKAFVHVYDTAGRMLINKHTIIDCLDVLALADPGGHCSPRRPRRPLRRANRGGGDMGDLIDRDAALAILAPAANSRDGLWSRRREKIAEALRALPAATQAGWMPPEDREDGYRCLGWAADTWVTVTWANDDWWTDWWPDRDDKPTAFAPLPPAPEGEG